MDDTEIGVDIPGVGGGKFKKIGKFPTYIRDGERLVDKLEFKKTVKYVTFEIGNSGELVVKEAAVIKKE